MLSRVSKIARFLLKVRKTLIFFEPLTAFSETAFLVWGPFLDSPATFSGTKSHFSYRDLLVLKRGSGSFDMVLK